MSSFNLNTHSINAAPWGARVRRVLQAALEAVDPVQIVQRSLRISDGNELIAGREDSTRSYYLPDYENIYLLGAGKAAVPMGLAAAQLLGEQLTAGVLVTKSGHARLPETAERPRAWERVQLLEASHPVPDESSVQATARLLELARSAREADLVLCMISGGGSALLTHPAGDVRLQDLQKLTEALLASGATIQEINALRKHLDEVKGGGLVTATNKATILTLVLSDVIGDPLDVIASGPTAPDSSTYDDAWAVLERYHLLKQVPDVIRQHLQAGRQGAAADTPKPGADLFERVQNLVIGSNRLAANAALAQARLEGFHPLLLTTYLQGEARYAGQMLAGIARQIEASGEPLPRPACLVAGGETTVTVTGSGLGGRNQELALGAVMDLADLEQILFVALATDGDDGPTDAGGATVSGDTLKRARELNLDPLEFLRNNDAYHFFEPLDDLLKPGPTQTNVNDLAFLFAF